MAGWVSERELATFARTGLLGPYALCTAAQMAGIRDRIDDRLARSSRPETIHSAVAPTHGDGEPLETLYDAHLDSPDVFALAAHASIVDRVVALLGPDLLLWRSTFWIKRPRARRIEWHQDTYKEEGFGSFPNVNAWIAVDEATEDNCMRIVAGSHRRILDPETFEAPDYVAALRASDALPAPPMTPRDGIARMALAPGQFFLFDGRVLHGSHPNRTRARRAGLVARFIPAGTALRGARSPCIVVAGADESGAHALVDPPSCEGERRR